MKKQLLDFRVFAFLLAFFATCIQLNAQCFTDRHNLTLSDSWISCEETLSPNLARGNSNWIMYDLGTEYALGQSHFWNINNHIRQNDGMRNVAIDVSSNGSTWTEAALFELEKGEVSGFYEGVDGPDLSGFNARYLLITGLTNYGGDCMGLSEFKVEGTPATTGLSSVELDAKLTPSPNPFIEQSLINISLESDGTYDYTISTITGQNVKRGKVAISGGTGSVLVEGDNLLSGAYMFTISNGTASSSIQLIKQ